MCDSLAKWIRCFANQASAHTVGILTGYGAQLQRLKRDIAPMMDSWANLKIEVNTVDAFQGREAEVAI